MQINSTNSYLNNVVGAGQNRLDAQKAKQVEKQDTQVEFGAEYASAVKKSLAYTEDVNAVEQAKKALAAGELDTPEAAAEAAQNMLSFGI